MSAVGKRNLGWGQTTEVCFDAGLLACYLLPGPLPERTDPLTAEQTQQDGHQQPADKKAEDVDNRSGWHQHKANQEKPERMKLGSEGRDKELW